MPRTKTITIKVRDLVPQFARVDQLLKILPQRTQNGEQFGIKLMPANRNEWSVSYFSHFSNTSDDRFDICVSNTPQGALKKMVGEFLRNDMVTSLKLSKSLRSKLGERLIPKRPYTKRSKLAIQ